MDRRRALGAVVAVLSLLGSAARGAPEVASFKAQPRDLLCSGHWHRLEGRWGQAARSWARAIQAAERLAMPYELARAHLELGRQLAEAERSPLGLDRAAHLDRAAAGFEAMGSRADLAAVHALTMQRAR